MARTKGSINVETMKKFLAERFPGQGWEEEADKGMIKEHYYAVMDGDDPLTELVRQSEEMGLYK